MEMGDSVKVAKLDRFAIACAALALTLAGCAYTPEERQAAAARRAAPTAVVMSATSGGAGTVQPRTKSPDGYPTFGDPLTAANVQMSDEQAANLQHQLSSLATARQAGTISEAEYQKRVEEMRKLAADHGPETLSEINR